MRIPASTVTPITWDVVGLDSNDPVNSGPEHFPVAGAGLQSGQAAPHCERCSGNLVWTSSNGAINLPPGSLNPIVSDPAINLSPGQCHDFYFEISDRSPASSLRSIPPLPLSQRHRLDGTSTAVTASSPTPRQIFVEHLVSQSRNAVTDVQLDGSPSQRVDR